MEPKKTHKLVNSPTINARYLADFMAASEVARTTILRKCKYPPIAPLMQHIEAKAAISNFLTSADPDLDYLTERAKGLRDRMAESDFDRDRLDTNADYLDRFAKMFDVIELPDAEMLPPGKSLSVVVAGVKVPVELHARMTRTTKTNKVKSGLVALRYTKGKPLNSMVGAYQSSFLFGVLGEVGSNDNSAPEHKLCLTIDGYAGVAHAAPGDATTRYKNMKAACAGIAERWTNLKPPEGAIF